MLDTNVVSELTRVSPDPKVIAWVDRQNRDDVYTTAVTKAEIIFGLECMPSGKRRIELQELYRRLFLTKFLGRVLPFDEECSNVFGHLAASTVRRGLNISTADLQISAIAITNGFVVATRNSVDFDHDGLQIINPWMD